MNCVPTFLTNIELRYSIILHLTSNIVPLFMAVGCFFSHQNAQHRITNINYVFRVFNFTPPPEYAATVGSCGDNAAAVK